MAFRQPGILTLFTAGGFAPAMTPGGWYFNENIHTRSGASNTALVNNGMVAVPFLCGRACIIDKFVCQVGLISAAPKTVFISVYASTETGAPGAFLADLGSMDWSVAGDANSNKFITGLNFALGTGLFWFTFNVQGAGVGQPKFFVCSSQAGDITPSWANADLYTADGILSITSPYPNTGGHTKGYLTRGVSGARPATFPALSVGVTDPLILEDCPIFGLHVLS